MSKVLATNHWSQALEKTYFSYLDILLGHPLHSLTQKPGQVSLEFSVDYHQSSCIAFAMFLCPMNYFLNVLMVV
jgi:hypothetical protein